MKTHRAFSTGIALVFFAGLLAWTTPPTAALAASTTFSGRATVVSGTVAGIPIGPLADTGEISPSGDAREVTVLEYPISGLPDPTNGALTAEVLHAAVVAGGNSSRAEASVANLALRAAGQSVGADFLMARASATCNGSSATVTGSSEIASLTVNGQSITVSGDANQTISLPGLGRIVINEQVTGSSASANEGDITVNALHVVLVGGTDLVVASAHADIACGGTPPCARHDFVTGGGWITTSSGSRANFAVAGGIKNDQFWGHLTYIDHGRPAMKVKGTAVTAYVRTGETSRQIAGAADIDGVGGTYIADVMDGGEPGHGVDTFSLSLSNGYNAGGPLGGGN
ncbi:MAG: choice-of-anchor P family protein, partial [Candidatus Limnocylindria bacterium]